MRHNPADLQWKYLPALFAFLRRSFYRTVSDDEVDIADQEPARNGSTATSLSIFDLILVAR